MHRPLAILPILFLAASLIIASPFTGAVRAASPQDSVAPTITDFRIVSQQADGRIVFSFTATDNTALRRAYLYRAVVRIGTCDQDMLRGCFWKKEAHLDLPASASAQGPWTGTLEARLPASATDALIGLHVEDTARNRRFEPNPPGPLFVSRNNPATVPDSATELSGDIESRGTNALTVAGTAIAVTPATVIVNKKGATITFEQLQPGNPVTVVFDADAAGNATARAITVENAPRPWTARFKGLIARIDLSARTLTIAKGARGAHEHVVVQVTPETNILGPDGAPIAFEALQVGNFVRVEGQPLPSLLPPSLYRAILVQVIDATIRDTVPPVISVFDAQPRATPDGAVTVSWIASDDQALKRMEVWIARYIPDACEEAKKQGCFWFMISAKNLPPGLPPQGPWSDSVAIRLPNRLPIAAEETTPLLPFPIPQLTRQWFIGLHALDGAKNIGFQPNPPGPILITTADTIPPPVPQTRAILEGSQEVPPVSTTMNGDARITFNFDAAQASLDALVTIRNGKAVTAAHLHCAPRGVNGPVVIPLFAFPAPLDIDGAIGRFRLTDADITPPSPAASCTHAIGSINDLMNAVNQGDIYANVHTSAHPGGEIRGQFSPIPQPLPL